MSEDVPMKKYVLPAKSKLAFQLKKGFPVDVTLNKGKAEIFGTELLLYRDYQFTTEDHDSDQVFIYTWQGAEVTVRGETFRKPKVSKDEHLQSILQIHGTLEHLRNSDVKPRVLICGESCTGKTSVVKILSAYAARLKSSVFCVDLDMEGGLVAYPGCIGAVQVNEPATVIGADFTIQSTPLMYFLGDSTITKSNSKVYERQTQQLAHYVNEKVESTDNGGLLVDTRSFDGHYKGFAFESVIEAINLFKISILIVNGGESYYQYFTEDFQDSDLQVVHLPHFPGVSAVKKITDPNHIDRKMKKYFYGLSGSYSLKPHSITVRLEDVKFVKVTSRTVPRGSLPLDQQERQTIDYCDVQEVDPSKEGILNKVYALSCADTEEEISRKNIFGLVHIHSFNEATIVFLCPMLGELPGKYVLISNLSWSGGD